MTPRLFLFSTGIMAGTAAFFLTGALGAVMAFVFGGNFALLSQMKRIEEYFKSR